MLIQGEEEPEWATTPCRTRAPKVAATDGYQRRSSGWARWPQKDYQLIGSALEFVEFLLLCFLFQPLFFLLELICVVGTG